MRDLRNVQYSWAWVKALMAADPKTLGRYQVSQRNALIRRYKLITEGGGLVAEKCSCGNYIDVEEDSLVCRRCRLLN